MDSTTGTVVRTYVTPFLDQNVSVTIAGATAVTYYYSQDERQSVMNMTDSTGAVAASYGYTAYGDKVDGLTSNVGDDTKANRYTYTGRELSAVSEDYYFRYRAYSASTGSFHRRDPLGYWDGMSMYGGWFAVKSSMDPFGLEAGCCCCVESLDIYNIKKIPRKGWSFGHSFDVSILLAYQKMPANAGKKAGSSNCTFEWWEKTNRPIPTITKAGGLPDKWYDALALTRKRQLEMFKPWFDEERREKTSPSEKTPPIIINDAPEGVLLFDRYLDFRIVVKSTPGCGCINKSMTVTARQELGSKKVQIGVDDKKKPKWRIDITKQEFKYLSRTWELENPVVAK